MLLAIAKQRCYRLALTMTEDSVTLSITDNGQGFDMTRQGHMGVGLLFMRERMKALGGDVQVESTPGVGVHIMAFCRLSGVSTTLSTPAPCWIIAN